MISNKLIAVSVSAIVVIAVIAAGAWYFLKPATETGSIKIGMPDDYSGPLATFSTDHYKAALMAVEEINEAGGILGRSIEITKLDTGYDSARSLAAVTRLVEQDKVDLILCHAPSPPPLPEIGAVKAAGERTGHTPIYFELADGNVFVDNYVKTEGTEAYWNTFILQQPLPDAISLTLIDFLEAQNVTPRTVAMISDENPWPTYNARSFRRLAADRNWIY